MVADATAVTRLELADCPLQYFVELVQLCQVHWVLRLEPTPPERSGVGLLVGPGEAGVPDTQLTRADVTHGTNIAPRRKDNPGIGTTLSYRGEVDSMLSAAEPYLSERAIGEIRRLIDRYSPRSASVLSRRMLEFAIAPAKRRSPVVAQPKSTLCQVANRCRRRMRQRDCRGHEVKYPS